jgi:hypothetical protein
MLGGQNYRWQTLRRAVILMDQLSTSPWAHSLEEILELETSLIQSQNLNRSLSLTRIKLTRDSPINRLEASPNWTVTVTLRSSESNSKKFVDARDADPRQKQSKT